MTQTFTGPEFEIEFYRAKLAWAKGGKKTPNPDDLWEASFPGEPPEWLPGAGGRPRFTCATYRWKPAPKRMVMMYDCDGKPHELVAPEVDAPLSVDFYTLANDVKHLPNKWCNLQTQRDWLSAGLVFLTQEHAQAMADFQRMQRGVK